jgi:hypothetical protein
MRTEQQSENPDQLNFSRGQIDPTRRQAEASGAERLECGWKLEQLLSRLDESGLAKCDVVPRQTADGYARGVDSQPVSTPYSTRFEREQPAYPGDWQMGADQELHRGTRCNGR